MNGLHQALKNVTPEEFKTLKDMGLSNKEIIDLAMKRAANISNQNENAKNQ